MTLREEIKPILDHIEKNRHHLDENHILLDIFEGNLKPYVERALEDDISPQAYKEAKSRIAPINVLQRIIDKQSKIYQQNPVRHVEDGTDSDAELLDWYEKQYKINATMNGSNEFFNMSKSSLIEPYVHDREPRLRVIPSDRYLPYSNDAIDPLNPTHIIVTHGSQTIADDDGGHQVVRLYRVYTADEWAIIDSRGFVRTDMMGDNPDGINPYGVIPFVYVNRSSNLLVPCLDSDLLTMTVLLAVLISDLNLALKMLCNSIIYTIDAKMEGMVKSPNAVWQLKTDVDGIKPELGTIDPNVDSDKALDQIQAQFSLWLNTKGIKPGSIGKVTAENMASGISKMVDEMDTSEDRQKQVTYYVDAEADLWALTKIMHKEWLTTKQIEQRPEFSANSTVTTSFSEQLPMMTRGDVVEDLQAEVDAGFTTVRRSIKKLNPTMTDREIDELVAEIQEEKTLTVSVAEVSDAVVEPEIEEEETEETEETEDDA